ncbi:MAG: hypothetical protein WAM97_14570 [Acidimicrobiales bacterium]
MLSTELNRVDAFGMVLMLAVLAVVSRLILGPVGDGRIARFLRISAYVSLLALLPSRAAIEQFSFQLPRGNVPLLLYRAINGSHSGAQNIWLTEIVSFLVPMALYAAAIVWMTSRRSRVTSTTLVVGAGLGLLLGVVMYMVAPLGISKVATNPWIAGSDIDPLVLLAWILVVCGPGVAGAIAYRKSASSDPPPPIGDQMRQFVAAGLLANIVGALFVAVLSSGTIALMINVPSLQHWLYNGRRLLFGVSGLQPVLRGDPGAIAYSHQITAVSDSGGLHAICIGFLLIAVLTTGFIALLMWETERAKPDDPRPGHGGKWNPEPAPDRPDDPRGLAGAKDPIFPVGYGRAKSGLRQRVTAS